MNPEHPPHGDETPSWPAADFIRACFSEAALNSALLGAVIRQPAFAWTELIAIASQHFVLPGLYLRLRQLDLTRQLPADVAECLEALHDLNLEHNRQSLDELATMAHVLNGAGIEPVVLKGAAYLLTGVYAEPGARVLRDIDLLVPPNKIAVAVDALREAGFRMPDPDAGAAYHCPLICRAGRPGMELHHMVGIAACERILPAEEMLARSIPLEYHGARVRVPCAEHLLLHHILHCQLHHGIDFRVSPPLRNMVDLVLLHQRFGSAEVWRAVAMRFRQSRCHSIFAAYLLDVEEALGFPVPAPVARRGLTGLRRLHRRTLRRRPVLRYIDPLSLWGLLLEARLQMIFEPRHRRSWRFVLMAPLRRSFYRHVAKDLAALAGTRLRRGLATSDASRTPKDY